MSFVLLGMLLLLGPGLPAMDAVEPTDAVPPPAPTPATAGSSLSHGDKSFMRKAARASTNEVVLAQLAASRASSPTIEPFAQMMITDHDQANADLKVLAASKDFDLTRPIDEGKQDNVAELSAKTGTEFDQAFAKLMVQAHEGAVALFKKEVADGRDPDVVAFARKYVDTLGMHLAHAQALEQKVGP